MYLDTAQLIWNGNVVVGKDNISKFLQDLPVSEFKVESYDAQPFLGECLISNDILTIMYCDVITGHGRLMANGD